MAADLGPNTHLIGIAGSRGRLNTPALLLDLDALERNIANMAAFAREHGIGLRPHRQTHKPVALAPRQIPPGAPGTCCPTLGPAGVDPGPAPPAGPPTYPAG